MIDQSKHVKIGPACTVLWNGAIWGRFHWTSPSMTRIKSAAPAEAGEIWAYHVAVDWRQTRRALCADDGRQIVGAGAYLFARERVEGSELWTYRAERLTGELDASTGRPLVKSIALPAGELPSLWIRALTGVDVEVERDLSVWQ